MHALEAIHAALRPSGALLDVRPAPLHPWVEIVSGDRVVRLGQLDESYRHATLATADAALQTVLDAGRFARECATTFTFTYSFDCVDAWLEYMAEQWRSVPISADLVARARAALPAGTGALRIPHIVSAARLRPR